MVIAINSHTNTQRYLNSRAGKVARNTERYLWALFLTFLLMGILGPKSEFEYPSRLYRLLNYSSYVWVLLLLQEVFMNFGWLFRNCLYQNRFFTLYKPLIFIVVFGLLTGFLLSANKTVFYRNFAWDFMPMFSLVLGLLGGGCLAFRERLPRIIALQSIMASLYTLWVYLKYPVITGRLDFSSPHYMAFGLLVPCVFALTYLRYYSFRVQVGVIFSFAVFLFLIVTYETRGGFLTFFILFPLLLMVIRMRLGGSHFFQPRIIFSILAVMAIAHFLLEMQIFGEQLNYGYKVLLDRFYGGEMVIDKYAGLREKLRYEYEFSRGAEAKEFIEYANANFFTWIVGNGYGSSWRSNVMGSRNWGIVHFGPLHLVFKGGLPLSILFIAIVFAAMRRSWKSIRLDALAGPCLSLVFCRFMGFLQHGPFGHSYINYIFWVVLGMALACGTPEKWHQVKLRVPTRVALKE